MSQAGGPPVSFANPSGYGGRAFYPYQLRAGVLANTVDFMTGPFRGDEGEAVKAAINEVHIQFAIENPTLSNALSLLIFFVHTQMDGTKFYATLGYCVSVGDLMNTQGSAPGPYIIPTW